MSQVTKILFLSADPTDAARLRLGEEVREIRERLQLSKMRNKFSLEERHCVRASDLTQALFDVDPHIVHFSGHGTSKGSICLEDRLGSSQPISKEALSSVFELFSKKVSCVVLNACFSQSQAEGIVQNIHYVIGTRAAIQDSAAISFSVGFYRALANGKDVEEAFRFGLTEISLSGGGDPSVPELLINSRLQERMAIVDAIQYSNGAGKATTWPSIPGRAHIRLVAFPGTYALINPSAYANVRELLDELFVRALSDRFSPYSYGAEWILNCDYPNDFQAAAPLAWAATGATESIFQLSPEWDDVGLKEIGIIPGSSWEVEDFHWGRKYYGVATNNEDLSRVLLREPKAIAKLVEHLNPISFSALDEAQYAFRHVFRDWLGCGLHGQILTEKNPDTIGAPLRRFSREMR